MSFASSWRKSGSRHVGVSNHAVMKQAQKTGWSPDSSTRHLWTSHHQSFGAHIFGSSAIEICSGADPGRASHANCYLIISCRRATSERSVDSPQNRRASVQLRANRQS
ncbi:hypothetical protein RBSH_01404 [Rhodopirellula baltica SH28]|uniref:Uncharacterized protein n=1 Tax=Rhodopirellula baltica SH28 TaxID=993517 RepID=K5CGZ4_RHOBT|nr:hypothetical protein RBSH_01404 [Rhodopirellula baltica SH28]